MTRAEPPPWSDVPSDILGLVAGHLPLGAGRLGFRAVCRSWHASERSHPPPRDLPALGLGAASGGSGGCGSSHFLRLSDGAVHRLPPLPEEAVGSCCCGAFGDWLVLVHHHRRRAGDTILMKPFPHAKFSPVIRFPCCLGVRKVVLSSAPDSGSCLAAAVVSNGSVRTVALCRPGSEPAPSWKLCNRWWRSLEDVAFHKGKLHAVDERDRVFAFELGEDDYGEPQVSCSEDYPIEQRPELGTERSTIRYLVESSGKLLLVVRYGSGDVGHGDRGDHIPLRTSKFGVFALERGNDTFQWVEVNSLDGQILFLSQCCSGAFAAVQRDGIEGDCIYFTNAEVAPDLGMQPFRDSGVYSMRDKTVLPFLPSEPRAGHCPLTWLFFPNDAP